MSHRIRRFTLATTASVAVITALSLAGGRSPERKNLASNDEPIVQKPIGWCGTGMPADAIAEVDPGRTMMIERLRGVGQPALDDLCAEYDTLTRDGSTDHGARLVELRGLIDAVAAQRDAVFSRLFWHTDWQRTLDEAARTRKPILSLRLLGRLDEDRSCANSRYFRTILYANKAVSDRLRERFVLHWESLRPVPQLTIDFGDGRRIERTITGNSIHYVLNSKGELIDGIPGLYGPSAFVRELEHAEAAARETMSYEGDGADDFNARQRIVEAYHRARGEAIHAAWTGDLMALGWPVPAPMEVLANPQADAMKAMPIAPSKMRLEVGAVHAVNRPTRFTALEDSMNDDLWTAIAGLHADDAALDERSIDLMREKVPTAIAESAQELTHAKRVGEAPFMRMLRTFHASLAEDTVRNEYLLHRQIHEWLAASAGGAVNVKEFNERVYAQLFLTPLNDPWMGLAPDDAFAALDAGGLTARME